MSDRAARVHLVGGGADCANAAELVEDFAAEVVDHAAQLRRPPRLALVMADRDGRAGSFRAAYTAALDGHVDGGFEYVDVRLNGGSYQDPTALRGVDGIVVAGGPTADYHAGLRHLAPVIQRALADQVPYLGFSAGAMIAPATALLGGWQDGGRAVCDPDWSEGYAELTLAPGLGLVDITVGVHATQAGLLSRACAAALRPECGPVIAIDEATVLSLPAGRCADDEGRRRGEGFVWWLETGPTGRLETRRLG